MPAQALIKKINSMGDSNINQVNIIQKKEKDEEIIFIQKEFTGGKLENELGEIIRNALQKLAIKKVMSYQLKDGWTSVNFVDAHHLLILHGRYICKASKPECFRCVIDKLCEYKDKTIRL